MRRHDQRQKDKKGKKTDPEGRPLSERETAVLWLVADGLSNEEIGEELGVSPYTAKFHVENAMAKLGARSRTKAAVDFVLCQGPAALVRIRPASPKTSFAVAKFVVAQ